MSVDINLLDSLNNPSESVLSKEDIKNKIKPLKNEIDLIPNLAMRELVSVILYESDFFWDSPSSNLEDHFPPDEYQPGGLVLHTKRTIRAAFCIANAAVLDEDDITALLTASLIHAITIPVLPNNLLEDPTAQVYDLNYMISIDNFIINIFNSCIEKKIWPSWQPEVEMKCQEILEKALRLVHCGEGVLSPIPELYPSTVLETIFAASNITAKSLHVIVDGVDVNEERWEVGNELQD